MSRRRIAIVLPSLGPVGGVEAVRLLLAEHFIARGYDVDIVLAKEEGERPDYVPTRARVIVFGVSALRHVARPLVRYLKSERPDAVLVAMWPLTAICLLAHRFARVPSRIVVSDHNTLSEEYASRGPLHLFGLRASIALTYRMAHGLVAVSKGVADDVSALGRIPRPSFHVVYNPLRIEAGSAQPSSIAEAAWKGWSGKRIITVGRLKRQKNHALLIRAFKRLSTGVDARLMIVGVGEMEAETRACIARERLEDKIIMVGFVADPAPYYCTADLFVLSSDYEGFGNVLVEALACGVPVVSTDCPSGPAEILENGRFGRLVPVGDDVALAQAIGAALRETQNPTVLKSRAAEFSPTRTAEGYLALLFPDRGGSGDAVIAS